MLFILSQMFFLLLRYLNYGPDFFGHEGKQLDKKAKVIFKIYDVTNWETNNCNKILPDISKSKGSERMEFGQLLEYHMKNAENEAGALFLDLILFFYKTLKASDQHLVSPGIKIFW